jgi:hypothetical protein
VVMMTGGSAQVELPSVERHTATRAADDPVLDRTDLRMAVVAVSYYQRAHVLSKRPVPPAADRLAEHLQEALSARGHDCVACEEEWLGTRQIAVRLGCSERTARRLAERSGRRIGRDWFIAADALPKEDEEHADAHQ